MIFFNTKCECYLQERKNTVKTNFNLFFSFNRIGSRSFFNTGPQLGNNPQRGSPVSWSVCGGSRVRRARAARGRAVLPAEAGAGRPGQLCARPGAAMALQPPLAPFELGTPTFVRRSHTKRPPGALPAGPGWGGPAAARRGRPAPPSSPTDPDRPSLGTHRVRVGAEVLEGEGAEHEAREQGRGALAFHASNGGAGRGRAGGSPQRPPATAPRPGPAHRTPGRRERGPAAGPGIAPRLQNAEFGKRFFREDVL